MKIKHTFTFEKEMPRPLESFEYCRKIEEMMLTMFRFIGSPDRVEFTVVELFLDSPSSPAYSQTTLFSWHGPVPSTLEERDVHSIKRDTPAQGTQNAIP